MTGTGLLAIGFAFAVLLAADPRARASEDARPRAEVDPEAKTTRVVRFRGKTFGDLSAYLYAGDASYGEKLRSLNRSPSDRVIKDKPLTYFLPRVRIDSADTLQKLGALWAGGSARSYLGLLKLNPGIEDPDHVPSGGWLYLPRIPRPQERERWKNAYARKNGPSSGAPSGGPCQGASSPFVPENPEERLRVTEWYLENLDPAKDRARLERMIRELVQAPPKGWKARYAAGQFYLKTDRPREAREQFALGLGDDQAPIQVALFFFRAAAKAGTEPEPAFRQRTLERFPALKGLLEAGSQPPTTGGEHP